MVHPTAFRSLLLLFLFFGVLPFGTTSAQELIPIEYGTAAVNTIPADGSSVGYTFNGNVGDLVTIRAIGISPGADPTLALVGPSQQVQAINDNVLSSPFSTAAQIVFRLQESGPHTIVVGGTPGDFLLTLENRPSTQLVLLQLETPLEITLPVIEPAQTFVFNTDPVFATTVLLDAIPFSLDAYVELRDGTGQVISTLRGNLDNACISVGPGDQLLELSIIALPEVTGAITLTLSNAPCILGEVPVEIPPSPTPEFTPVVIEGVCAASSSRNVNIRSGPGTNYARLALLRAGLPIQVTGQSQDGQWFVVQNEFIQGWVAARVVAVTGPCAQLPVVAAPPLPPASPTPGFPVIIVQPPLLITTTPGPTFTPVVSVVTATSVPQPPTSTPPQQPAATLTPTLLPPTAMSPTLTTPIATVTSTPTP
jgi:hypothetical protein